MLKTRLLASAATLATATLLALGLMAVAPSAAVAGVCPALTGGDNAPDCTVLLTINPNGTVTATDPSGLATYDGSDDAYVGIQNNTSQTLNHFFLTGPASPTHGGIFGGMDGDGICTTNTYSGANCTGKPQNTTDDYAPAGVTLTEVTANTGFVDFAGGLAPGASGYFSLEEPVSITGITLTMGKVPEPATLALFGAGLLGLGFASRRRRAR